MISKFKLFLLFNVFIGLASVKISRGTESPAEQEISRIESQQISDMEQELKRIVERQEDREAIKKHQELSYVLRVIANICYALPLLIK